MNKSKFPLIAAALSVAILLTLSCSSGGSGDPVDNPPGNSVVSSSSDDEDSSSSGGGDTASSSSETPSSSGNSSSSGGSSSSNSSSSGGSSSSSETQSSSSNSGGSSSSSNSSSSGGSSYSIGDSSSGNSSSSIDININMKNITISLRGKSSNVWNGSALRISVNGISSNYTVNVNGYSGQVLTFRAKQGDLVEVYWVKGNCGDRCAFAIYYEDSPPSPAFNAEYGATNDIATILTYRQYGSLTSTANGALLGGFIVADNVCNTSDFNPSTQFCYGGKIVDRCGINPQSYDPYLYQCKPSVNLNGIFLKKAVNYQGEIYEAVLIGVQTWMARNLNYNVSGSKCISDNGVSIKDDNTSGCNTYGRLYNWTTATGSAICPQGWHLPTNTEWNTLMTTVDAGWNPQLVTTDGSLVASKKLKATSGWANNGTDDYGFSALPGGSGRNPQGDASGRGSRGNWQSATSRDDSNAYYYYISTGMDNAYNVKTNNFYSVRCVED